MFVNAYFGSESAGGQVSIVYCLKLMEKTIKTKINIFTELHFRNAKSLLKLCKKFSSVLK